MAKIQFSAVVGDARKKAGGVVFTKGRTGAVVRRKVSPTQPRSQAQRNVRSQFTAFSKMWGTLSDAQRAAWTALAATATRKDVFGNVKVLTGLQLFQSCNRNLDSIGATEISDAPASLSAGAPGTLTLTCTHSGTATITGVVYGAGTGVFAYSGTTNWTPAIGDTVIVTGFANQPNNVAGLVTAVVPATSFSVAYVGGITETKAALGLGTPPLTADAADAYDPVGNDAPVIYAAPQLSPGRSFVGKKYRIVKFFPAATDGPWDITLNYVRRFGAITAGKKVNLLVAYIDSTTGAKGTPSAGVITAL